MPNILRTSLVKKTDKKDSQWIARITRHELINHSFIPDKKTRATRDIVRIRKAKIAQRTRTRQQIHNVLICAGIQLATCISDIFGVSGRFLINCIISKRPITKELLQKEMHHPLDKKIDKIFEAIPETISNENRFLLGILMEEEASCSKMIAKIEAQLEKLVLNTPERKEVFNRLLEIPGFSERSAMLLIGEIGIDLKSFPSHDRFSSWCGLAPGNKESAGKNLSGRIKVRQFYLRSLLVEVSFAAIRCKGTYYSYKFFDLRKRKSTQKAIIAIARKISIAIYNIIALGKNYEGIDPEQIQEKVQMRDFYTFQHLVKKLGEDTSLTFLGEIFKQQAT